MATNDILRDAKERLEAEKRAILETRKRERLIELQAEKEEFVRVKTEEAEKGIEAIHNQLEAVIESKQREIEAKAEAFAQAEAREYDAKILALDEIINKA